MTQPRLLSINNYHYRRGGAEVVYLEHNQLFEESGWEVVPFAMHHPNNLPATSDSYFVEEIEFGNSYGAIEQATRAARIIYSREAQRKIAALVRERKPRIAHAHNVYHHISPSIFPVLRDAGVPVVMTVHDLKLACPAYTMRVGGSVCERCRGGRIHNVVLNRCIKGSAALSTLVMLETAVHRMLGLYSQSVSRFVAPSRFIIDKLVAWGWERQRFAYIPNFVAAAHFTPSADVGRSFLYFGRLSPEKGLDTLIRAAAQARQSLTIVGTGPEAERLRALAGKLGADVNFPGYLSGEPLHAAVRAARAVVLPSTWYENAPISILEAYALARPVIGSDIGGISEMIRPGETGAMVPPGDVGALAAALTDFAGRSDAEIAAMGGSGRAMVEADFSRTRYRDRMLALYAELQEQAA